MQRDGRFGPVPPQRPGWERVLAGQEQHGGHVAGREPVGAAELVHLAAHPRQPVGVLPGEAVRGPPHRRRARGRAGGGADGGAFGEVAGRPVGDLDGAGAQPFPALRDEGSLPGGAAPGVLDGEQYRGDRGGVRVRATTPRGDDGGGAHRGVVVAGGGRPVVVEGLGHQGAQAAQPPQPFPCRPVGDRRFRQGGQVRGEGEQGGRRRRRLVVGLPREDHPATRAHRVQCQDPVAVGDPGGRGAGGAHPRQGVQQPPTGLLRLRPGDRRRVVERGGRPHVRGRDPGSGSEAGDLPGGGPRAQRPGPQRRGGQPVGPGEAGGVGGHRLPGGRGEADRQQPGHEAAFRRVLASQSFSAASARSLRRTAARSARVRAVPRATACRVASVSRVAVSPRYPWVRFQR